MGSDRQFRMTERAQATGETFKHGMIAVVLVGLIIGQGVAVDLGYSAPGYWSMIGIVTVVLIVGWNHQGLAESFQND